jgi:hypothetical protein
MIIKSDNHFINLIFMVCVLLSSNAYGDNAAERFQTEYPAALRILEAKFSRVCCQGYQSEGDDAFSADAGITEFKFRADHGFQKISFAQEQEPSDGKETGEIIQCFGRGTAFNIVRQPKSTKFQVDGNGIVERDLAIYVDEIYPFVNSAFVIHDSTMTTIMATWNLVSVKSVSDRGLELIQANFDREKFGARDTISVTLNPALGWVITSSEYHVGRFPGMVVKVDTEYGAGPNGEIFPLKVLAQDISGIKRRFAFENWTHQSTDPAEFDLSHYGLFRAEVSERSTFQSYILWPILIGLVGIVVAVLIRYRAN